MPEAERCHAPQRVWAAHVSRLVVKPGLTGWAQVCYPNGSSTEDALRKLQYDLFYIRHQSLMRDLLIMVRTVGTMLTLGGV